MEMNGRLSKKKISLHPAVRKTIGIFFKYMYIYMGDDVGASWTRIYANNSLEFAYEL